MAARRVARPERLKCGGRALSLKSMTLVRLHISHFPPSPVSQRSMRLSKRCGQEALFARTDRG